MKYLYFFAISFILLFLFSFSSSQNKEKEQIYYDQSCSCMVRAYYIDGNKRVMLTQYSDTITWNKQGFEILFFESGDTASVTKYVNNNPHGYAYNKHDGGAITTEFFFNNGVCDSSKYYNYKQQLESKTYIYSEFYNHKSTFYYQPETQTLIYADHFHGNNKPVDKQYSLEIFNDSIYQNLQQKLANRTGKELFLSMCASCHNPYKDATGPKLQGVTNNRSEQWLKRWITNSSQMIADGDKEAVSLFNQWHKTAMPSYPNLSEQQMQRLLDYLKTL